MNRILLVGLLSFALVPLVRAQDTPASDSSAVEKIKANPDDADALNTYLGQSFQKIGGIINSDPDKAEQELKALGELLETLKPENEKAAQLVARGKNAVSFYQGRLELARITVAELEEKLKEKADARTISQYATKIAGELREIALTQGEAADKKLQATTKFLTSLKDNSDDEAVATAVDRAVQSVQQVERYINAGKLVGTDAPELQGVAWVNGTPLTPEDLKGKVVLLDFWAVWCGPCIATFPHLIEWNEKYGEDGLVIVGVTRYYQRVWDDEAGRAVRPPEGEVTPELEHEMLEKFAEHHKLHHRFLLQEDSALSKHFAVTGIPHVALIDRSGTVRLVRIGSGPANAKDINEMLEKLIAEDAS